MAKLAATLQKKMHIRFWPLRSHILFFIAKFGFAMCRRHVLTYTSHFVSYRCVIFARQGYVSAVKTKKLKITDFDDQI